LARERKPVGKIDLAGPDRRRGRAVLIHVETILYPSGLAKRDRSSSRGRGEGDMDPHSKRGGGGGSRNGEDDQRIRRGCRGDVIII